MKTIQNFIDELKEEGYDDEQIRPVLTERLQKAIADRLAIVGAPAPDVVNAVGQQHLGACFGWVISLVMAGSTDDEIERAINDFEEFRRFDIAARHYQAMGFAGE